MSPPSLPSPPPGGGGGAKGGGGGDAPRRASPPNSAPRHHPENPSPPTPAPSPASGSPDLVQNDVVAQHEALRLALIDLGRLILGEPARVDQLPGEILRHLRAPVGWEILLESSQLREQIPVGTWPVALVVAENTKRLYCSNRGNHTVSVVDLAVGKETNEIAVVRDPAYV